MLLNNIINNKMKEGKQMKDFKKNKIAENRGITLMALIVTIIVNRVFYDKNKKYSNLVGSPMIYINL